MSIGKKVSSYVWIGAEPVVPKRTERSFTEKLLLPLISPTFARIDHYIKAHGCL